MDISENKINKLLLGILFDGIGMLSYVIPGISEFTDVIWAPISGWLMTRLYKGTSGKIAGAIALIEEAMPGLDIIPTFTLMWVYTYVIEGKKDKKTVEVKS